MRPGGVVAFVTSRYTMDAKDSTVRRYLAQRAELLGAIRLPNDAFKKNAGAEVVSDIIFLQKRDRPLDIVPEWTQTGIIRVPTKSQDFVGEGGATEQASFSPQGGNEQAQSATTQDGFAINRYFLNHPEMVLGRQEPESTAHGMDYTVNPIEGLEVEIYFNFVGRYIPPALQPVPLTPEEQEELRKKEERKDRLHQNYLRRKANGKQKEWEERYNAKRKAQVEAAKAAIRAEDMEKGVFIPVSQLPRQEPRKAALPASAAV